MYTFSTRFVKAKLKELGITPEKAWGQNFLISKKVANEMVSALEIQGDDLVVEIGGGLGAVTNELRIKNEELRIDDLEIEVYETERKFVEYLERVFEGDGGVRVKGQSILECKPEKPFKLIGSVPYSITSKVFRHFLYDTKAQPKRSVLLVQEEIAKRITAKPGEMSLLSLSVQLRSNIKLLSKVPPGSFWPKPKVDSRIILLAPKLESPSSEESEGILKIAKAGFLHKRKLLKKNLKALNIGDKSIAEAFNKTGIGDNARAEELSVENWKSLVNELKS